MRSCAFTSVGMSRNAPVIRALHRALLTIHVYKRRIIFDTNMLAGGFARRPLEDIACKN